MWVAVDEHGATKLVGFMSDRWRAVLLASATAATSVGRPSLRGSGGLTLRARKGERARWPAWRATPLAMVSRGCSE
jgi:hypothetical protein